MLQKAGWQTRCAISPTTFSPCRLCRRPQLPVPGAHSPFFAILPTLDDQHHFLQHPSQTVDIGGSNSPSFVIPGKQWPAVLTSIDLVWKPSIAAHTNHTGCSQHHSHAGWQLVFWSVACSPCPHGFRNHNWSLWHHHIFMFNICQN